MTRIGAKTLWRMILIGFIAGIVVFFAVATSGFKNWNGNEWFDYWGKGKPVATKKAETPKSEQSGMTVMSYNNGLLHDSDDGTATIEVKKMPAIGGVAYIEKDGVRGFNITSLCGYSDIVYPSSSYVLSVLVYDLTNFVAIFSDGAWTELSSQADYSIIDGYNLEQTKSSSGHWYDAFLPESALGADHQNETVIGIAVYNAATGEYINSDTRFFFFIRPSSEMSFIYDVDDESGPSYLFRDNLSGVLTLGNYSVDYSYRYSFYKVSDDGTEEYVADYGAEEYGDKVSVFNNIYTLYLSRLDFSDRLGNYRVSADLTLKVPEPYDARFYFHSYSLPISSYFGISKLSTPTDIRLDSGSLLWNEVPDAVGYAVFMDSTSLGTTTRTSMDLSEKPITVGEHLFRVRAIGNAVGSSTSKQMTAFNASNNISELVALNFYVNGSVITQLVESNRKISDYLYEVKVPGKVFGGWYLDNGYSVAVKSDDIIHSDTTIYARLSDKQVTDRPLTWWEQNRWYVLIPCFILVGIFAMFTVFIAVRKKHKN